MSLSIYVEDGDQTVELVFEHSLLSISKWEAKYETPFFGDKDKTVDETSDYFHMMLLTDSPPKGWIDKLNADQIRSVADYINSKQTATYFREEKPKASREVVTSEQVYFWLSQFRIPFQPTESWHFNRIMMLVKIAGVSQTKPKKLSKKEIAEQYRDLNEKRRRELGTNG